MSIHAIVAEVFQSGANWWTYRPTDWQVHIVISRAIPLAWLKRSSIQQFFNLQWNQVLLCCLLCYQLQLWSKILPVFKYLGPAAQPVKCQVWDLASICIFGDSGKDKMGFSLHWFNPAQSCCHAPFQFFMGKGHRKRSIYWEKACIDC